MKPNWKKIALAVWLIAVPGSIPVTLAYVAVDKYLKNKKKNN